MSTGLNRKLTICLLVVVSLLLVYQFLFKPTPLPDVQFKTITGEIFSLSSLQGKPVVLAFWASDCANCLAEISDLKKLAEQNPVIAIAMYYDPPNQVLAAVKAYQLTYPVVLDLDAQLARIFGDIKLTPSHILIDSSGRLVKKQTGALNLMDWQLLLAKI